MAVTIRMKRLAFCFLIYDIIHHEKLWSLFFKNIDSKKYSIYIHYKTQTKLAYFEKYKIKNCIQTNYDDFTIPLAYNILFREAYRDKTNYKFIILSGACIPLKSFNFIYDKLTNDDYGYFNISPSSQCFPNCNSLLDKIDTQYISKSHNWFILNRNLVVNLCFDKDGILQTWYKDIYAPAEYFYYTYIKILKCENEIHTTENLPTATTFTNWADMDYIYRSDNGLKNYTSISEEELLYLLNSPSLFGRKFTVECGSSLNNSFYSKLICS